MKINLKRHLCRFRLNIKVCSTWCSVKESSSVFQLPTLLYFQKTNPTLYKSLTSNMRCRKYRIWIIFSIHFSNTKWYCQRKETGRVTERHTLRHSGDFLMALSHSVRLTEWRTGCLWKRAGNSKWLIRHISTVAEQLFKSHAFRVHVSYPHSIAHLHCRSWPIIRIVKSKVRQHADSSHNNTRKDKTKWTFERAKSFRFATHNDTNLSSFSLFPELGDKHMWRRSLRSILRMVDLCGRTGRSLSRCRSYSLDVLFGPFCGLFNK